MSRPSPGWPFDLPDRLGDRRPAPGDGMGVPDVVSAPPRLSEPGPAERFLTATITLEDPHKRPAIIGHRALLPSRNRLEAPCPKPQNPRKTWCLSDSCAEPVFPALPSIHDDLNEVRLLKRG